ncbi:hypothetical protein IFM89_021544, partial [Coptis chinensis]
KWVFHGVVQFHQYQVVGRALPTESEEHPKIFRMKLWATNEVRAKSKFWYFSEELKKVKKSNGQVLAINEVFHFFSLLGLSIGEFFGMLGELADQPRGKNWSRKDEDEAMQLKIDMQGLLR